MASSARASVIMGVVLILGLIVGQMEAKSCCRNTWARNCYNTCRLPCKIPGQFCPPRPVCASGCNCIHITSGRCPANYPSSMLEDAASLDHAAMITDYCKLGCVSSACVFEEAMTSITNDNTEAGEGEAKQAAEHCKNACSDLCNNKAAENFALA